MRRLSEDVKVDVAVTPQETTGVTSVYFKLDRYDRAAFIWQITPIGASAIVTTSTATLYQAKNASAATSGAALASSTAILSIGTKAKTFTITPQTAFTTAETITITAYDINGDAKTALVFTSADSGTAAYTASTSRYFAIADSAGGTGIYSTAATNLAAILNNATYGVPGLYASASATNVACRAIESGENMFTLTSSSTTNLALNVTSAMGMIEVSASVLTLSSSFTHVAINIVNQLSALTSAVILRKGRRRLMPVQTLAALTSVGE
jgi:hypothetical protein